MRYTRPVLALTRGKLFLVLAAAAAVSWLLYEPVESSRVVQSFGEIGDQLVVKVKAYLKAINNTIRVNITEDESEGALKQFMVAGSEGSLFIYKKGYIYFNIGFTKRIKPSTPLSEVRDSLNFVALDRLPLEGFKVPRDWIVYPMTMMSSFKKGVNITYYNNGHIRYHIDCIFFAIYGVMPSRQHVMEISPPGTFFRYDKDVRGIIDIDLKLKFSTGNNKAFWNL